MIVITGSIPVDGSKLEAISPAANAMREATLQEDGCEEYRFSIATDDPNTVLIVEEWHDQQALTAHLSSPHTATFQAAIAGIVTGAPTLIRYEVTSKGPLR
jgi:quinol monooxygenase YgiN